MTQTDSFIRNAVLASLRNEEKLAITDDADANGPTEPPQAKKQTTSPTRASKEKGKTNSTDTTVNENDGDNGDKVSEKKQKKKKKKRSLVADSNWKALQKTIPKPKRPRNLHSHSSTPSSTPPVTLDGVAEFDAALPTGTDRGKWSAFMQRAIRTDAELTPIVALDCEMVGIGPDGRLNALARVSVVNYSGDVLYDTFVRAGEPVTDYRTQWSGVRAADIDETSQAVSAFEAQRVVGALLKGRVVVGHAIKNDFKVLRIAHPWSKVRDTSAYFKKKWNFKGNRRPALRVAVAQVLGVDAFQKSEHDSCEDARAALALYKKCKAEWERSVRVGGTQARAKEERK